ncbi:hypothetical protein DPEC_G00330480 [Dallia pectoralis]|uniref:Uncharacterized protein n=1 Tax=Dallia pectoralis TaxID=75939 RepID=A0ACC2F8Y3_DALPE|nr:hypothetical protein DPEC_G00330480 [Dallia pectoralis]
MKFCPLTAAVHTKIKGAAYPFAYLCCMCLLSNVPMSSVGINQCHVEEGSNCSGEGAVLVERSFGLAHLRACLSDLA